MGNRHFYLQNMEGDPKLITSFTGGNFAINGDANVSFNVANGGNQAISANQGPVPVPVIAVVKPVVTPVVKPAPLPVHSMTGPSHGYLVNLNGGPKLTTSFTGGNFAVNGNAAVKFNVANGGKQGIAAHMTLLA